MKTIFILALMLQYSAFVWGSGFSCRVVDGAYKVPGKNSLSDAGGEAWGVGFQTARSVSATLKFNTLE